MRFIYILTFVSLALSSCTGGGANHSLIFKTEFPRMLKACLAKLTTGASSESLFLEAGYKKATALTGFPYYIKSIEGERGVGLSYAQVTYGGAKNQCDMIFNINVDENLTKAIILT